MSQLGHFRAIQPGRSGVATDKTGSRDNSERDGGKRPLFSLAKISQRLFFRTPPAFAGNSPRTLVDDGRAASSVRPRTHRDRLAPEECRSPGASQPLAPAESRGRSYQTMRDSAQVRYSGAMIST